MAASTPKKLLTVALAVVAGLVALVVLVVALVSSGAVTKRAVDLVLPRVSAALGREVTLERASLRLFPHARVSLGGLAVAGRPGEPPLVQTEALDVEVGLWPLVRSLGKDVVVRSFTLVRPTVNLVRAKDGTWNYEGLGQAPGGAAPRAPPAPAAEAPAGAGPNVAVGRIRVEKAAIQLVDRSAGGADQAIALKDLDLEATNVGPGLPVEARLDAALAGDAQNLHAALGIAKLPAAVPQAPEDWPEVQGTLKLDALALDRLHALFPGELGAVIRGGTASLDAKLTTKAGRGPSYHVDGGGALADVRLRGQPASGRFRAAAAWAPAKPDAATLELSQLAVKGPGVDLGGTVSVATGPLRATFALAGPLLDLDAVMGVLPEQPAAAAPAAKAPAPGGAVLPEATRRQVQAASARGTIAIDRLKGGRLEATNVKARAVLSQGVLTLEQLDAGVFGGQVSGSGTQVSLREPVPTWKLATRLAQLDLGQAVKAFSGGAPVVAKVNGDLQVSGSGTDWEKIRDALTGLAALLVQDGTLTTTSLGDEVLGAVAKGLEAAGRGGFARKVAAGQGGKTTFRDLSGKFTVKDGVLTATAPFTVKTDAGNLSLGGGFGLDGRLDLSGTIAVPREHLAKVVSGVPLPATVELPLTLGGTLQAPRVGVRAEDAARALVRGQAEQAKEKVRDEAERAAQRGVGGLLDRLGGGKRK